ncbi:MAG: hypothetical protein WAM08_17785 [Candidatus Acidiferrales bacterium]
MKTWIGVLSQFCERFRGQVFTENGDADSPGRPAIIFDALGDPEMPNAKSASSEELFPYYSGHHALI